MLSAWPYSCACSCRPALRRCGLHRRRLGRRRWRHALAHLEPRRQHDLETAVDGMAVDEFLVGDLVTEHRHVAKDHLVDAGHTGRPIDGKVSGKEPLETYQLW